MKKLLFLFICVCILGIVNNSYADTVTYAGRYFADRSEIQGYLYSSGEAEGDKIQVTIGVGLGLAAHDFSTGSKWDWTKVRNVTRAIRGYIDRYDDIEPIEMLTEAGLVGVKFKSK